MSVEYKPLKFKCHEKLQKYNAEYWNRVRQARASGKRVVWCSAFAPPEIAMAMDFIPIFVMNNSASCGAAKVSTALCERAEMDGYSPDLCSYPRTDIGSALMGEETLNPFKPPKPDLIFVTNGQCHSMRKWNESLAQIFNAPMYMIDTPFMHDDADAETRQRAKAYVKDQLQEFIAFLEDFTGQRYNYDRLGELVELSGRMTRTWLECLDMRENSPSPISVFDIFTHLTPMLGLRSTAEGASYYEEWKEEIAERVKNKIGAFPNERFRLHLDGVPLWFNLKGLAAKYAQYGAVPITHVYPFQFSIWAGLDSSRPLDSIAECMLSAPVNRGIKQRAEVYINLINKYRLDGVVMQMGQTCKALCESAYLNCEEVEERTGVPCVTYDTDFCDARLHYDAEVDSKLQAFIELLESRASRA